MSLAMVPRERLLSRNTERVRRMGPKVVYTDLDGTMLGRGGAFLRDPHGADSLEPARALLEARAAGIDVVPCSGRAVRGLVGDARLLGMENVIAEMGAVVAYEAGREVVRNLGAYPGGDVPPARYMEDCGAVGVLLDRYAGKIELHTPWSALRDYTQLFRGLVDPPEVNAALADAGHGWLELVDNGLLHSSYLDLGVDTAHAYHLVPRGVSKGTAIAIDQRKRVLKPSECVAIGDAVADLEIAAEVALLVLVRDAVERDRGLAERGLGLGNVVVTDRPGNLGWADALTLLSQRP